MKNLINLTVALLVLFCLSGCIWDTATHTYIANDGTKYTGLEKGDVKIMATKDQNIAITNKFQDAIATSTSEGQRIALMAFYFNPKTTAFEHDPEWYEYLLPWANFARDTLYLFYGGRHGSAGRDSITADNGGMVLIGSNLDHSNISSVVDRPFQFQIAGQGSSPVLEGSKNPWKDIDPTKFFIPTTVVPAASTN